MAEEKKIKVKLVKSTNGCLTGHVATVRGLGLRRRHQTVTVADTAENRGMIYAANHLLKVERS